uniref:Uncharacterized protein n=1 Tax=Clytia hemisphaerica TaxID=252671 RepID=A0A7M5UM07_9CNID
MAGAFERKEWLSLAGNILAILQKLTQAVLYKARLQNRCAIPEKKIEAIWYLRALSLFNLLMWMNDLINLSEVNDMNLKTLLGQPSNLVSVLYDSLVVEYRLLMSMIFLEHS